MPRLNVFENFPAAFNMMQNGGITNDGILFLQRVYLPGSLSFNNVALLVSAGNTTSKSLTISFGLYSLNGATLSLANSASNSSTFNANTFLWFSLATSTTQDLTPGEWFLGVLASTSSNASMSWMANSNSGWNVGGGVYGGPFFRGYYSTTSALPASIATSHANLKKDGTNAGVGYKGFPYILLSA